MLRAGPGKPPYPFPFTSGVDEHSLFARRLEPVATQRVDVGHAHAAALVGAGSAVPFPRATALLSICLTGNVIGRWTGARGVAQPRPVACATKRYEPRLQKNYTSWLGRRRLGSGACELLHTASPGQAL